MSEIRIKFPKPVEVPQYVSGIVEDDNYTVAAGTASGFMLLEDTNGDRLRSIAINDAPLSEETKDAIKRDLAAHALKGLGGVAETQVTDLRELDGALKGGALEVKATEIRDVMPVEAVPMEIKG